MKKDTIKYISYLFLIPCVFLLTATCKTDNELQSSLSNYEPILSLSRYINYNLSSSSQVKGVYKLSLSSTQSFDANYWGWEQPASVLSNGDKTISTIETINDTDPPGPQFYDSYSANPPFSDGKYPVARAYTGIIRPLSFESIERTLYNANGELAYDADLQTYSLTYDATTDLIKSYSILTQGATAADATLNIYGFSSDPRSYSSYYASSYTKKAGADNTLVGSVTTEIEVDNSTSYPKETYTYQRFNENAVLGSFDASGDLGYLESTFFDDANGSPIIKIVTTVTYFPIASVDVSADSIETETIKYSSETESVYKEITIEHYENFKLRQLADYQYKTFDISGDTESQTSQLKKWYNNGFLVLQNEYLKATGWDTPSGSIIYERDAQGRITSLERKDATGDTTNIETYTFDNSGRTQTIRSYNVDSSSVETCNSSNNKNYNYETDSATDCRLISIISYDCSGDSLSETPTSKITNTYNSDGKLIKYQLYTYTGTDFLLTSQTTSSYGSDSEKLYDQAYSVDATGDAVETIRTEYTYDDNLYRTSTVYRDASGDIALSYYQYSYTYK